MSPASPTRKAKARRCKAEPLSCSLSCWLTEALYSSLLPDEQGLWQGSPSECQGPAAPHCGPSLLRCILLEPCCTMSPKPPCYTPLPRHSHCVLGNCEGDARGVQFPDLLFQVTSHESWVNLCESGDCGTSCCTRANFCGGDARQHHRLGFSVHGRAATEPRRTWIPVSAVPL